MNRLVISIVMELAALSAIAQESINTGVRRRNPSDTPASRTSSVRTARNMPADGDQSLSPGDVQWMRVLYRELDLDKGSNPALFFPEEVIDGNENLFRIILRGLLSGQLQAYEYLDGKELFTDPYKVNVAEMLDRFEIPYTQAKGSTARQPKLQVDETDVPCTEVLSYYIIERNTFDNRQSRLKTKVEAICPVLHRVGDYGGEPLKYPMFWVKYSDLRPMLTNTAVFIDDDNNQPSYSYADFFDMCKYSGDIYKTRNLRNKSMVQLYPDPADMKRAQDSIQARIDGFEDKLWVPDREEIIGANNDDAGSRVSQADADKPARKVSRGARKPSKAKVSKSNSSSRGTPVRSVRRRK